MITITHTHAGGTLIEGSAKGDGVYEVLKGLGDNWRWFPSIRQIGIGQSRDRLASTYKINRAAEALRAAGHEVATEVDDTGRRPFAEAEQERYDRADSRADYHAEAAEKAESRAAGRWEAEHAILDGIPFGQPILVGHHSEARHRRDLARADSHMRHGIEEIGKRDYHQDRAASAETYQASREDVPTTLRRIKKLEADQRRAQRKIAGRMDWVSDGAGGHKLALVKPEGAHLARLEAFAQEYAEQLAYWREHVRKAQEESGVKVWSAADFAKGDYVLFYSSWYEVVRVNGKSLTIPAMINDGVFIKREGARCTWTDTIPYDKVRGRKSGTEVAGIIAEADRREHDQAAAV